MVAILEPIIEEDKVFDCFLLNIAGMPAAVFIGLGVSVGTVIVGKDWDIWTTPLGFSTSSQR